MSSYRLSDFDYLLPPELIAQVPTPSRSASRLLVLAERGLWDGSFTDLPGLLRKGDLLVFNDSKVIPARLNALKETGGAVELLVERITSSTQAQVLLRASKKPRSGATLKLLKRAIASLSSPSESLGGESDRSITPVDRPQHTVRLVGRDPAQGDRFIVDFEAPVFEVLNAFGELPLPPYITHDPTQQDISRYQTVYAQHLGSVAAPTAGLHFDTDMLDKLANHGVEMTRVTLHVGSGTFSPVRSENLVQHRMHSEWCSISPESAHKITQAKQEGRRVVAVGTTSLRTLESAAQRGCLTGGWETDLFITPGYEFNLVDALITNFHLPKSTLLMLVSAFSGYDQIKSAYTHAIKQRYRFFSYGDAMFLTRSEFK